MNTTETIQDRLTSIESKAQQVNELHEEVQQIEKKRTEARNKNSGFEALQRKLSEVHEQYEQLEKWAQCADRMEVDVDREELLSVVDDVRHDVDTLHELGYDDFNDRSDIDDRIETFETHRNTLRDHADAVKNSVQEAAESEREAVDRIRSLLQIPDIGTADDSTVCQNYRYILVELQKANLQNVTLERLEQFREEFHALEIGLGDDLSDEAKDVIWDILEDETVTLADISGDVLSDLKHFEEFSNRLSVEFTESQ